MLLPLCTLEEVRAELAETEADLESMVHVHPVDRERWEELRQIRLTRREKLIAQIAQMEAL